MRSTLWQMIYWIPTPVLAGLAGILIWRKLARQFPFFFSYVVVASFKDLASFAAYHGTPSGYFKTYWISHLASSLFMFLATYELFIRRLFPRSHMIQFYRYLFPIAAVVIVGLSFWATLGGLKLPILYYSIRVADFLRVAVLLFFVALMLFMRRQWSRYEFGIALGLGIDSAVFLMTFALFLRYGPLHGMMRELPAVAGDAACLVWFISFLDSAKPAIQPAAPVSPQVLQQARKWEETLKESLTGKKPSA